MVTSQPLITARLAFTGGAGCGSVRDSCADTARQHPSASEGQTYTEQTGYYRKLGDECFFWLEIIVDSLGTLTTSKNASIGDLPFAAASLGTHQAVAIGVGTSLALASTYALTGAVIDGAQHITLQQWGATTGTSAMIVAQVSAGVRLDISESYITA